VHSEAPPASTSDEDRHGLVQSFDDMQNAQNAYREANQEREGGQGSAAGSGVAPAPAPPPKKGPAEQATKQQVPKP